MQLVAAAARANVVTIKARLAELEAQLERLDNGAKYAATQLDEAIEVLSEINEPVVNGGRAGTPQALVSRGPAPKTYLSIVPPAKKELLDGHDEFVALAEAAFDRILKP